MLERGDNEFWKQRLQQLSWVDNRLSRVKALVAIQGEQDVAFVSTFMGLKRQLTMNPQFVYGMTIVRKSIIDDFAEDDVPSSEEVEARDEVKQSPPSSVKDESGLL